MRPKQFTLSSVKTTSTAGLLLRYVDGEQFEVSLVDTILQHPSLERLKEPEVFHSAKVGDHGASVIWANDDELELAADNLRARAVEQAGGVSHEFIWNWMARNDLTVDAAALALGVSRRMLAYYRSGSKPVPRTVALACLGWEKVIKNDSSYALAA
jgi:predicted DNA-binding transcriptional regulator AlpA